MEVLDNRKCNYSKTETYTTATKTGYAIGQTDAELEPFLNQEVYIYGQIEKNRSPLTTGQIGIAVKKSNAPINSIHI